jgi:hypothetical protein
MTTPTTPVNNKSSSKGCSNGKTTRKKESERQLSKNKTTRRDVANFEKCISEGDYVIITDPLVNAFLTTSFDDPSDIL